MPRGLLATTVFTLAVVFGLTLAPPVAPPAIAYSNPELFAFDSALENSTFFDRDLTVSGVADPASGSLQIVRSDDEDGCSAVVDPLSGAFSCSFWVNESNPSLDISAQHQEDEKWPVTLGTVTVSVLLPPELDGIEPEMVPPTIISYSPSVYISGWAIPQTENSNTVVRVAATGADGDVSCTAMTDSDGFFVCALPSALLTGTYDLFVTQEPSWAEGTRSLPALDGVTLIVDGPVFVIDGEAAYTLEQGDSLTLNGALETWNQEITSGNVITATMSIAGSTSTPFTCRSLVETNLWECSLATAPTRAGLYTVELAANAEGQLIARDRSIKVTVIGAPIAPIEPTPSPTTPPEEPLDWTVVLGGFDGSLRPGDPFSISSSNLPPGSTVDAEIRSTPIALGSTIVGADGTFRIPATIPLDIEPGDHTVVVTVTAPGREPVTSRSPITVLAVVAAVEANVAEGTTSVTAERNEPGAPNSLSESIRPFWETLSSPLAIGSAVLAGLVFLVFAAFPAELLIAAIKQRYSLLQRRGSIRPPRRLTKATTWFATRPVAGGLALVATASLIIGFADPAFGFDLASLRLFIAGFLAALIVSFGAYQFSRLILRRRWSLSTRISLRPYTLIITVIGVVLSRVLDFSPGFLFGLMLSLSFPVGTTPALRARARVLTTGVILGVSVVAWVAFSFVSTDLTTTEPSFGTALVQDSLVALSTVGLTGMLIAMLPFLLMDGHEIWHHSKRAWAGVYAAVVAVFFLVVAPKPDSWGDLGPKYGSWMLALGGFTIVSLAVYFWVRWDTRRQELRELQHEADRELQSR